MSERFEPEVVAFCCRHCAYAAADLAGSGRQAYSTAVKVVELPCTGRIDIINVLHAFENGADGVLIAGCLEGKCHYLKGNLYAKRRARATCSQMLDDIGLERERARMINISAAMGVQFAQLANEHVETREEAGAEPAAPQAPARRSSMIVAEQKALKEILKMLEGRKKVLAVGCGTCVTVCLSGGRQETAALASSLRMATRIDGKPRRGRRGDRAAPVRVGIRRYAGARLEEYDAVLSLGCGVGVQTLAERFPGKRILPALNTKFMGMPTSHGVWEERCIGCGNCILDKTGGVCPVSRCAKQLFNGPCGGSEDGHCEVAKTTTCAWHKIWERAEALGMIDALMEITPPKDWSTSRDGGPRRIVREDLRLPSDDPEAGA